MKWRKRPVVIEAWHFVEPFNTDRPDWVREGWFSTDMPPLLNIVTLEGVMRAQVGDWIIKGVKGEVYPCKPDIFEATYEPADE